MKPKICKVCCGEVGDQHSEIMESKELVVVDEKWQLAYILNKDDCLCADCSSSITYYRGVKQK